MDQRLKNKVAVVTGASKGIGAAIARQFGREGAKVVVNYSSSRDAAERVVADIRQNGGDAVALRADMSNEQDVQQMFADAHRIFGRIDVLVNNAGIYDFQSLADLTEELFQRHFKLNVYGYLLAAREAVRYMPSDGSIINLSSTVTLFGPAKASVYTATKGAIDGLTRSLSTELGPRKIRVNAIKPGVVATEGVEAGGFLKTDFGREITAATPLGRLGVPTDVAPAAVYLASDESSWMTGECITLSGGHR